MGIRYGRPVRLVFVGVWVCVLILVLRTGMGAIGTGAEHMIGLLTAGYLAAWGPYFLLSRRGPAGRAVRFAACSGSILAGLAAFEVPAMIGLVDYRAVFSTPIPAWRRPGNRPDPDLIYVREGHRQARLRFRAPTCTGSEGCRPPRSTSVTSSSTATASGTRSTCSEADVIVLGDSFIEGLHVAAPDLVSARLAGDARGQGGQPGPDRLRAAAGVARAPPIRPCPPSEGVRLGLLRGERPPGRGDL